MRVDRSTKSNNNDSFTGLDAHTRLSEETVAQVRSNVTSFKMRGIGNMLAAYSKHGTPHVSIDQHEASPLCWCEINPAAPGDDSLISNFPYPLGGGTRYTEKKNKNKNSSTAERDISKLNLETRRCPQFL